MRNTLHDKPSNFLKRQRTLKSKLKRNSKIKEKKEVGKPIECLENNLAW